MRLFIAFDASEEAEKELRRLQDRLVDNGAQLSLASRRGAFHLTLKFLGETQPDTTEKVKQALETIRFGAFDIHLGKTGVFPSPSRPRVVWIGLEPAEQIKALQQQIESALEKWFEHDKRFTPHLTLARVKSINDKDAFAEAIEALRPKPIRFTVKEFILYESRLSPKGATYTALQRYLAQS